jgi:hypothetical protein
VAGADDGVVVGDGPRDGEVVELGLGVVVDVEVAGAVDTAATSSAGQP